MRTFHEYISKQFVDLLRKRSVVVLYDPREEFGGFIDELPVVPKEEQALGQFEIQGTSIPLARFKGSYFGLRIAIEPFVAADQPEPLLLYVPGVTRDRKGSILMEFEKAGSSWEPQLKRLARNVLSQRYTEGVIDGMLAPETITYRDIVALLEQTGDREPHSILKVIFGGISDGIALLASWPADAAKDDVLQEKEAVGELYALISSRLGLEIPSTTPLSKAREKTSRYVLVSEFRSDLQGEPPPSVSMIPVCATKEQQQRGERVTQRVQKEHPETDAVLAQSGELPVKLGI